MTKKDYIVIAKVFAQFAVANAEGGAENPLAYLIDEFASYAENDNSQFNEKRFREFVNKEVELRSGVTKYN